MTTHGESVETVLKLEGVGHRYGTRVALSDVDLEVTSGEVVALVGKNGAGKTTLMRLVTRLLELQEGVIERADDAVGWVPQSVVVWPDLTVGEQLEFMCDMQEVRRSRALASAETVGLDGRWDTLAAELSGGMQRRLSIALALVHEPRLLVLDEPNAGLDPGHRLNLRSLLERLASEGAAVLVSSHDLDEVERVADRIAILEAGALAAIGSPKELAADGPLEERFS